jgi:hypothetical protein
MFIIFYFDQILNHPSAYIIIIKNHRKYMKIPFDSKFNFFLPMIFWSFYYAIKIVKYLLVSYLKRL